MKRILAILLLICLILAGCSADNSAASESDTAADAANEESTETSTVTLSSPAPITETVVGYKGEEIKCPDWVKALGNMDSFGNTLWFSATTSDGQLAAASYDTVSNTWSRVDFSTGEAQNPEVADLSISGNVLWVLLREDWTEEQILNKAYISLGMEYLKYYLVCVNLTNGESVCTLVDLNASANSESSTPEFNILVALNDSKALLSSYDSAPYIIDPFANSSGKADFVLTGGYTNITLGNTKYIYTAECWRPIDPETLTLGEPISDEVNGAFSSVPGHLLTRSGDAIGIISGGTETELFKLTDVALSYATMHNCYLGLENSEGNFFYLDEDLANRLIKVSNGEIPAKKTLTLAAFIDTTSFSYQLSGDTYSCTEEMMDAIIRFNNTDPEYKIVVKPYSYGTDEERDRILIELATSSDIDVIDTSLLPENAIKAGVLEDMLPYIDADEDISRDDFIEPLLKAMLKDGGLYEYTDKFTLLTVFTRADSYPGKENWTCDELYESLKSVNSSLSYQDYLSNYFIAAATAEFMDWDAKSCSFDSEAFINWLKLLDKLPSETENASYNSYIDNISADGSGNFNAYMRFKLGGDYIAVGFPESRGSGTYFKKLNRNYDGENSYGGDDYLGVTIGRDTRIGIMAASANKNAAWRFVRTMMLSESSESVSNGIPCIKSRFEKSIEYTLDWAANLSDSDKELNDFTEADAEALRETVYGASGMVSQDEALLGILREQINAYLGGKMSAEDAASQIQSRATIYMAEQG